MPIRFPPFLRALRITCALVVGTALAGAPPAAAEPAAASSADKQRAYLQVIERFVAYAERFWVEGDLPEADAGHYEASGPGVTQPRGAGNMALAAATLLEAHDRRHIAGLPREVLAERVRQTIRHSALTHRASGAGHDRWGGGEVQASLETAGWGLAAALRWDVLDGDTRALVRRVLTAQADATAAQPVYSDVGGQTGAENNGWNTLAPALASSLFPDDRRRPRWDEAVVRSAVNASSRADDRAVRTRIDGRRLSDLVEGANLHPDLTVEHHGFFNPIYQVEPHISLERAAVITAVGGREPPSALGFRTEAVWERVTAPLVTDRGDLVMPQGQDWFSKDGQHLAHLASLAARFARDDAAALETRALETLVDRQRAMGDGSIIGDEPLGYESMLVGRAALAYWSHELFGPAPQPSADELAASRREAMGVRTFHHVDLVAGRFDRAYVSMSWHGAGGRDDAGRKPRPLGLVVPTGRDAPPVAYTADSLLGDARGPVGSYNHRVARDGFATAGTVGARRFAMAAFDDGLAMLLDHGHGATFRVAFDDLPGLPAPRPVATGEDVHPWVNVGDHLGMVVTGGSGPRVEHAGEGPHRRLVVTGSAGTGTGQRGAVVVPAHDRAATRRLAGAMTQLESPDGWSALAVRAADGSVRLAVARWDGPDTADFAVRDDRGAPLTRAPATVHGDTARFRLRLRKPDATGEAARLFARAGEPVEARRTGPGRARLVNPHDRAVPVELTAVTADGTPAPTEHLLAPRGDVHVDVHRTGITVGPAGGLHPPAESCRPTAVHGIC